MVCIPVGIAGSAISIKISVITSGIKTYKPIIKKKKKMKPEAIVLLGKTKLNTTQDLISKASIDSNTSHDEFVSVHSVLKKWWFERRYKKF